VTDRFRCSDASVERGEVPVATASQVQGWLLIEVHGAWGRDAVYDSHLGVHVPDGWKADLQRRGIRPICIRPPHRTEEPEEVRVFFVVAGRPGCNEGVVWTRILPTLAATRLVTDDLRLDEDPHGWDRHDGRIVVVCTNGKHDQCCANRGRPVCRHLRETRWAGEVWECSHIGGDRFAANLVILPDSLYFGRMEPAEAETILDEHAEGRIALGWYRGRSTLRFAEQAAEHAVRTGLGITGTDDVVIPPGTDMTRIRAEVAGVGPIDVALERTLIAVAEPLTCHGPGDQQVPHYRATELIELQPEP
jgi:hypothetical protein